MSSFNNYLDSIQIPNSVFPIVIIIILLFRHQNYKDTFYNSVYFN